MLSQLQLDVLDDISSNDLADYVYNDREGTMYDLADEYTSNDLVELLLNNLKQNGKRSVAFSIDDFKKYVTELIDAEYYNIKRY